MSATCQYTVQWGERGTCCSSGQSPPPCTAARPWSPCSPSCRHTWAGQHQLAFFFPTFALPELQVNTESVIASELVAVTGGQGEDLAPHS